MDQTERETWLCLVIALTLALITSLYVSSAVSEIRYSLMEEAVNRGYAEWVVIKANQTEFKWKEKQ